MRIQQFDVALDAGYRNVLVKGTARNFPEMERIRSPEDAVWVMEDVFGLQDRAEEYGYLICMTGRGAPIGFFEVSHGTCNLCQVGIREILVRALLCGAVQVIFVHNHPGGDAGPSGPDREVTASLKEACGLVGLRLCDHIIVSRGGYYSFLQDGKLGDAPPMPGTAYPTVNPLKQAAHKHGNTSRRLEADHKP